MSLKAGWSEMNLGASSEAVQSLDNFKTQMQAAISAVETIVSITKTVADFIVKFYFELENVNVQILKAAISTLRAAIKDLTETSGAYGLFVPMHIIDPYSWTGDPQTFYLGNRDTLGFPFLETSTGEDHISRPEGGSAGNYGFYATVAESLADQQDILRPQFDQDAYVASVVMLFGSDTYMELVLLAKKLMRLFKLPGVDLDNAEIPTPRDLTARVVPTPLTGEAIIDQQFVGSGDFSTKPYSVRLEWREDPKDWFLAAYGNARFEIREFVVNRWKDGEYTKEQILAGAAPDTKILQTEYNRVGLVIDREIEAGNVYWYSVGYLIDILDEDGNVTTSYTSPLDINAVRINVPATIELGPRHGVPPDWYAAPLLSFIPGLRDAVAWLISWLDEIEAGLTTGKDEIEEFLDFLQREINRYSRMANEITATLSEIIDAFTLPNAYAGMWVMKPGKGGNQYFLKQLGEAMFNADDRPPFDKGTEAVTGVVLYVGSATAGKIERFISAVELLFGGFLSSTQNTLKDAVDSLHALDEQLDREICLTQGLIQKECDGTAASTALAIGKDLRPSVESADCADVGTKSVS